MRQKKKVGIIKYALITGIAFAVPISACVPHDSVLLPNYQAYLDNLFQYEEVVPDIDLPDDILPPNVDNVPDVEIPEENPPDVPPEEDNVVSPPGEDDETVDPPSGDSGGGTDGESVFPPVNNDDETDDSGDESETPPIPEEPDIETAPEVDGFTSIAELFDGGTPFFGNYAYVIRDDETFIMDKNGDLLEIGDSLIPDGAEIASIENDKTIVKIDEKYGVYDIFGNIVVEPIYDGVVTEGDLILATSGNDTTVMMDGNVVGVLSGVVTVLSEEFLLNYPQEQAAAVVLNIADLSPASINGKPFISVPSDGVVAVRNELGNVEYYSYPDGEKLFDTSFSMGGDFSEGYAFVKNYVFDLISYDIYLEAKIIDKHGSVAFDFNAELPEIDAETLNVFSAYSGKIVYNYSDGTVKFGVIDVASGIVCDIDYEPLNMRIYGNRYIAADSGKIYSLDNELLCDMQCVEVSGSYFVVVDGEGKYTLLDANLSPVIEACEFISIENGVLLIKNNGKFTYYIQSNL